MINQAKLALIAAVAVVGFVSPALAQSFDEDDGTGNVLPFSSQSVAPKNASHHAAVHAAGRNGKNAFAMEPREQSEDPSNASPVPPFDYRGTSNYPWGPRYNFPYPDRPYGDPDHW